MKTMTVAKFNAYNIIKALPIFYGIYLGVQFSLMFISGIIFSEIGGMSGSEFITSIYLFGCGIGCFKTYYYFTQGSGISKLSFIKGLIISILPIAFITTIIDIIVNKISNMFMTSTSLYEQSYGIISSSSGLIRILETFGFQFMLSIVAYLIGVVLAMIFYKANKIMKIVLGVSPFVLIMMFNFLIFSNPDVATWILTKVAFLLGFQPFHLGRTLISFLVISAVLSGFAVLLMRKMEIKK
ncbi:MAG: hypothetical protein ACRC28_03590 [Clostridium sp.]|uniref:hypothetical protein n=1 Tax=Clostridium sp. TaxID=1506 RepID=UPI003F2A8CE6